MYCQKHYKIGDEAFLDCAISCIAKFPESLLSIGNNVFYNNTNLSGILEFPEKYRLLEITHLATAQVCRD